ncbi:MAG: decarboxylating 6-phosphogluconate dehydrogenase [Myxococcota bacterium]|nr:decarboxylating 6-phosphogluconate dehydrogenase [Myxococcota bacterium]
MQIGFVGLGKMGGNMVLRLKEKGDHHVVGWDRSQGAVRQITSAGAEGLESLAALVAALTPPRVVWMMVPAGAPVDETLETLTRLGTPGDVFVDGGNSHYKDSVRRGKALAERGFHLLDAGTSGGIWGREEGYCLMVGGPPEAFARLEPALLTLAPKEGYRHVGPTGAGHFCKMVHNGIEYGLMQAYAEGFALLEASPFRFRLEEVAGLWNRGSVVRSWLLELAEAALKDDPRLDQAQPWVEDTGEGRWTVDTAVELAVPAPVIALSLFARFRSRQDRNFGDRLLATLRNRFGGHALKQR